MATQQDLGDFYGSLFDAGFFVFESSEPYFQEKVLQAVWNEQFLLPRVQTPDGQRLQVVHPGIWNLGHGPDFRDAELVVGNSWQRGPVEVHFRPTDWRMHGHDGDPAYATVVLHVVWENPQGLLEYPPGVPLLVLRPHLDRPLEAILADVEAAGYPYARQVKGEDLSAVLAGMGDGALRDLLQSLGLTRLLRKARKLAEEIRTLGLEDAVFRQLCDIMGFRHNREAFVQVARQVRVADLAGLAPEVSRAVLFGAADLLPDPTTAAVLPEWEPWVIAAWRHWWPWRAAYQPIHWQRAGLRPYNAPERRLLAAHLLLSEADWQLGRRIIAAVEREPDPQAALRVLGRIFDLQDGEFDDFFSFSRRLDKPASLLGDSRRGQLLLNLALPLALANGLLHGDVGRCRKARELFRELPRVADNRRFKEAAQRFLNPPGRVRDVVRNAAAQQGLLQLVDDAEQRRSST